MVPFAGMRSPMPENSPNPRPCSRRSGAETVRWSRVHRLRPTPACKEERVGRIEILVCDSYNLYGCTIYRHELNNLSKRFLDQQRLEWVCKKLPGWKLWGNGPVFWVWESSLLSCFLGKKLLLPVRCLAFWDDYVLFWKIAQPKIRQQFYTNLKFVSRQSCLGRSKKDFTQKTDFAKSQPQTFSKKS